VQKKQRTILVDNNTLQLITNYLEQRKQFRYRGPKVFPIGRGRVNQILKKLGYRIGVPELHPQMFRHWFATAWINNGGDLKHLQTHLGHESLKATIALLGIRAISSRRI